MMLQVMIYSVFISDEFRTYEISTILYSPAASKGIHLITNFKVVKGFINSGFIFGTDNDKL